MALPTFTSQNVRLKGDLVAGRRHVALFSLCSPARLSTGGFLRSFCSFAATITERSTKELRSQHCATQQGQVGVRAGGREIEVRRRLWAKQVHHTAQAHMHTPVRVAMRCSCFCGVCPWSEEFGTTHRERPCMLTKRHTTPALLGADRKRVGLHRVHPQPTREHRRQADALGGRSLACNTLTAESLLRCIATCTDLNLSQEEGPLPLRRQ